MGTRSPKGSRDMVGSYLKQAMLQATMQRIIVLGLVLSASFSVAQSTPDIPSGQSGQNEKVIVVPMGDPNANAYAYDAGVAQPPPSPQPEPAPLPPPPSDTPITVPETRTIEALPPRRRPRARRASRSRRSRRR